MRQHSSQKWTVPERIRLKWQTWGDETIVYHCQSGDAHLLNVIAVAALQMLQKTPLTESELTNRIAESLGLESCETLCHNLETLLQRFDELGLVWPA